MILATALLALVCGALGWARAAEAAVAENVPRTLARTAPVAGEPARLRFEADFVGVHWSGPAEGAAIRLRRDDSWTRWQPLHPGDLHPARRVASELVAAEGATAYQVRLPTGARDGRSVAINTTDGPPRAVSAAGSPSAQALPGASRRACYRSRAAWGADESLRFGDGMTEKWQPAYFPVQRLTVHHTATEPVSGDPAAVVRAIYRFHAVDLGFGDIGYHLLVDEAGCVYEGRYSGADPFPVYGTASLSPLAAVNGGHVAGFNAGNVGVAVIGEFASRAPTRAARRSLTVTLAALSALSGLDPRGGGVYVNPISGATKEVPVISGHRDWLPTECPGQELYELLPRVRRDVGRLVGFAASVWTRKTPPMG